MVLPTRHKLAAHLSHIYPCVEIVIAGGTADDRLPGELVATGAFKVLLAEHTGLAIGWWQ